MNDRTLRAARPTWDEALGQREVAVPLAYLPADVELAVDFPEPIRYDAERLVLAYRGVMPPGSYQRLRSLSKDLPFQLAVDRLFAASAADRSRQNGRWLTCGGLSLAALVLLGVSLATLSWPSAQQHVEDVLDLEEPPAVVDVEPDDVLEAVDLPDEGTGEMLLIDEQPASS